MVSTRTHGMAAAQVVFVLPFLLFGCPAIRAAAAGVEDIRTGLVGTAGNDILVNTQPLDVNAILETASDQDVTTSAVGIDGLAGNDSVAAAANITTNASSTMDAPYVPFRLGGTTAASSSTGLAGGDGADLLLTLSSIFPTALSHAEIMEVILQIDIGATDFPTASTSQAIGIEGGAGPDHIESTGVLDARATSQTLVKEARISAVEVPLETLAFGDATTSATSVAVGILGDGLTGTSAATPDATEIITNHASLSAVASATSATEQGMVELIGAARVDDSTSAGASSAGIVAGANDSRITNYHTIYSEAVSSADMTSVEIKMKGFMLKPAFDLFGLDVGTFQTVADSVAVGIAGDVGDDTIVNAGSGGSGEIEAYARAEADSQIYTFSISPPLGGGGEQAAGALVAGSLALPHVVTATGDDDSASAYGDASTVATSYAAGILAGDGDDAVTNDTFLTSRAESEASNLTLSVDIALSKTSFLPLPGAAVADASTRAIAASGGIDGGDGDDVITNSSAVTASATADADSLGIAATIKGSVEGLSAGVSVTDASSTAVATSKGIVGGAGGDTITNTDAVTSTASASDNSTSVSATLAGDKIGVAVGVTVADAVSRATSHSVGIDAEDAGGNESASVATQNDVISNEGLIQSTAGSTAHGDAVGVSIAASLQGVSVSVAVTEADVASEAYATGVRSGIGEDTIENRGPSSAGIHATATATSSSDSVSVAVSGGWIGVAMGASFAEANTKATSGAVGVEAGDSNDVVTNASQIVTSSTATVSSNAVSVTAALAPKGFSAGVAFSETQTNSAADATGIDAGDGDDTVENAGVVATSSTATTTTKTVTVNFAEAGAAVADVSSQARANATGIDGGAGTDAVTNSGSVVTTATSTADDTSGTANLLGYARGDIASTSTATAVGISSGDGTAGETLTNTSGASITTTATANAYADDYVVQGGGVEFAKVGSRADARATGMAGTALADTIGNDGTISSVANSEILASNFSFNLAGAQLGSVGVNATATAVGIDGGDGANTITNDADGQIGTYADLSTTSVDTEVGVLSAQFVGSGVTADAWSHGILAGADDDTIDNHGSIDATANALGAAGGASLGLMSMGLTSALASAQMDGIRAGGGDDVVTNLGTIRAGAIRAGDDYLATAMTEAVSFDLFSLMMSSLGAGADVTGIQAGDGDDTVSNYGTIFIGDEDATDACTSSRSMVIGRSFGFGGQIAGASFAYAGSSARIASFGMDGGAGDDLLTNSGDITVKARSYADVDCETFVPIGLLDSLAQATSISEATATGIYGGYGDDVVENYGTITADALTISDAATDAEVDVFAEPHAESEAEATAHAAGIDGGSQGTKVLSNFGTIHAVANAGARPYAFSDSDLMRTHTEGYGLAESTALGITSASFNNIVTNHETGTISVSALAGTYDTLGNIGEAKCDEDANIDAGYYNPRTGQWTPLSAKGFGIALSDGNDLVINDGSITVSSYVDGSVYAYTNTWTRYPFSTARSVVLGEATGITAGGGSNSVTNNGQMMIEAVSYAAPKVDAWSRDYQATADAYGVSDAVAVGMEADGTITNSLPGVLDVTARATSWANAPTNSEFATATALVTATASGFATFTDTGLTQRQFITNDGTATVRALAGEDAEGNSQQIAWVNTNITTRDSTANCSGTSTVDAVGIRVGDGAKEITNNGTLTVLGRARADLTTEGGAHTYARSYYYNPEANSYATGAATATGVLAAGGENHVYNYGTMDVQAQTLDVYAWSDSYSSWSTCYSKAESNAEATGQGIRLGSGDDEIRNMGLLTVTSSANAKSYAYADTRDNNLADEYETSRATSHAEAIGIDGGAGANAIENEGVLSVTARALAQVYYGGGHARVTATTNATASATGITVGDGGSFIRNAGSIDALAAACYTNGTPTLGAHVVGILGGSGDDVIVNEGEITTSVYTGVFGLGALVPTAHGIGIDAGAGDDAVVLADGSSVVGDVLLGWGDDTLVLMGSPIVEGLIGAGEGSNTLLLDGAGWFDHQLAGFDRVMKQGPGTYIVSGLSPATRLDLGEGTLEIDGDYQFAEAGLLATVARTDGSAGQLKIGGTGVLNGTLAVEREQGLYQPATYDVVVADTLSGSFTDVLLPESLPLLEFAAEQTADRVQISVTPHSYASAASNEVEASTGDYLDRIAPQASGDLANTLGTFQTLSGGKFRTAFASLSPAVHESATATTFNTTTQYNQTLFKRMHSTRSHIESTDDRLAYSQTERHAIWMDGFGHWARQDAQGGLAGYDYRLAGAALGADRLMADDLLVGVSYGQSNADIDMDDRMAKGDIDSYFGSLYGSYFTDCMYVDATVSYGRQRYENTRRIEVGTVSGAAHSSHDGDVYSVHAETGWNLSLKPWTLQPFAALRYTFLDEDGYAESGAEGVNLRVKERKTDSLVSNLGLRFACPFEKDHWLCIPEVTVAWDHDFDLDDRRITAAFEGAPTTTFVTDGRDIDRDGLVLGAGLTVIRKNNLSLSLTYTGELRRHYTAHALAGGMRYEF